MVDIYGVNKHSHISRFLTEKSSNLPYVILIWWWCVNIELKKVFLSVHKMHSLHDVCNSLTRRHLGALNEMLDT